MDFLRCYFRRLNRFLDHADRLAIFAIKLCELWGHSSCLRTVKRLWMDRFTLHIIASLDWQLGGISPFLLQTFLIFYVCEWYLAPRQQMRRYRVLLSTALMLERRRIRWFFPLFETGVHEGWLLSWLPVSARWLRGVHRVRGALRLVPFRLTAEANIEIRHLLVERADRGLVRRNILQDFVLVFLLTLCLVVLEGFIRCVLFWGRVLRVVRHLAGRRVGAALLMMPTCNGGKLVLNVVRQDCWVVDLRLLPFRLHDFGLHHLVNFVFHEGLVVETFGQIFYPLTVVKDVVAYGAWWSHQALKFIEESLCWDLAPCSEDLSDLDLVALDLNGLKSFESFFVLAEFPDKGIQVQT